MTADEVQALLNVAIDTLVRVDHHLLDVNASERSVTHQLAAHLASLFPDYSVDCEYNRDGFDIKKLALEPHVAEGDALDAVTVFPDIVLHVRGTNSHNLLVVEVKKAASKGSTEYDLKKLAAFKSDLDYVYAAHLVIGYALNGQFVRSVKWY